MSRAQLQLVCGGLIVTLLFAAGGARAQIYTCVAEDGSRVFSDQRCGPDAKVVEGVKQSKRSPAKPAAAAKPARTKKTPAELEQLTELCDAGDMKACSEWTLGGGPDLLRERERKAELDCEAGSLAACEERYCREGVDVDCRARVVRTAKLAGDTWYLRDESSGEDGLTRYAIRCFPEGAHAARDIIIQCSSQAGPNRCYLSSPQQGFARLAQAAFSHCAARGAAPQLRAAPQVPPE